MIELQNGYKVYETGTIALRNVTLKLPDSGFVAIVGKSGCGKSTLINILSRADSLSKGNILYNNTNYSEIESETLTKDFAYVYQDFKLIENLSVFQNILIGQELSNKDIDCKQIIDIANDLGITEILDEKIFSLSGGQMQRVAIARAMARNPKVIFADEPTGNLDSENTEKVFNLLKNLAKDKLVVVVSHDISIAKWADELIEMENGKIINDYFPLTDKSIEEQISNKNNSRVETQSKDKLIEDTPLDNKLVFENLRKKKDSKEIQTKQIKGGRSRVFAHANMKSKTRKKAGLSSFSTFGLMSAFNNNGIVKKVILTTISIIMTMLIFLSAAVLTFTPEQTFFNLARGNKVPYIDILTTGRKYTLNQKEYKIFNDYIENKTNSKLYVRNKSYLNDYLGYITPAEDVQLPKGYERLSLSSWEAIYTDKPEDIGLAIVEGVAPKANDKGIKEIAISKTWYNFFNKFKKFVNVNGEIVDFTNRKILGNYIEEFGFMITGVFEDYNEFIGIYDLDKIVKEFASAEYYYHDGDEPRDIYDLYYYNELISTIIRPESALEDVKTFANYFSTGLSPVNANVNTIAFLPDTELVRNYFYNEPYTNGEQLQEDEIIISDYFFVSEYKRATGIELKVGMEIELSYVKSRREVFTNIILETYQTKTFKIKAIDEGSNGHIFMNAELFDKWTKDISVLSRDYVISSKSITPKILKDIRNFAYTKINTEITELLQNDFYKDSLSFFLSSFFFLFLLNII